MNIRGMILRPAPTTLEDYERVWKSSEFWAEKNFKDEYQRHLIAMEHIAECAKLYVFNNWKRVESWKNLELEVDYWDNVDKQRKVVKFFNWVPSKRKRNDKFAHLFDRSDQHNPIESFADVVLDTTDGDFSVTINEKQYWWISDDTVIKIADYIEKCINEQELQSGSSPQRGDDSDEGEG